MPRLEFTQNGVPVPINPELAQVMDKIEDGKLIRWSRVRWETVKDLLVYSAQELEQPASMIIGTDFTTPLEILGGRDLSRLYNYAYVHPERKDKGRVAFLVEKTGIEVTPDDVVAQIRSGRNVAWNRVNGEVLGSVLQGVAREVGRPASLLGRETFRQPLVLLEGRSLSGLAAHAQYHPDRGELDVTSFLLEKAGLKTTVDDVIAHIRSGGSIFWDKVPLAVQKALVERVGEELKTPSAMFSRKDFITPIEALGGRNLNGLYQYHANDPDRKETDVMPFISEKLDLNMTAEAVIERLKGGRIVYWDHIPAPALAEMLTMAAVELQKPVSIMSESDLRRSLKLLDGRSLGGVIPTLDRNKQDGMSALFEDLGISTRAEDVLHALNSGTSIRWERVSWDEIGRLLQLVNEDLGRPGAMLSLPDLRKPLESLGGRNLERLYNYAQGHPDRGLTNTVTFLIDSAGLKATSDEVVSRVQKGLPIVWDRVPPEELYKILDLAAEELGISIGTLRFPELNHAFNFLNGHKLTALYHYAYKDSKREDKDALDFLFEKVGIKTTAADVVHQTKEGRPVVWQRVPWESVGDLVQMVGHEIGVPASMLFDGELKRTHLEFLDGHSLGGLHQYAYEHPERGMQGVVHFILEKAGITPNVEELVNQLSQERAVRWSRIPWELITKLLNLAAKELDMPAPLITSTELNQPYQFLEQHGLGGLYTYCLRHKEKKAEESAATFLRRKTGLDEVLPRPTREGFRLIQMNKAYEKFVQSDDYAGVSTIDGLLPWINDIAKIYQNPILGINAEDLEAEIAIFLSEQAFSDQLAVGKELGNKIHNHLEKIVNTESKRQYKEKSLSTHIAGTENVTLGDMLRDKSPDPSVLVEEEPDFNLPDNWDKLTGFQRKLVLGIAVDTRTLEDMAEELDLDIDTLKEHYADVITILRGDNFINQDKN